MEHQLAPDIFRQRLLIEGHWTIDLGEAEVNRYLHELPAYLDLRIYSDPIIYSPGGDGKAVNQGYDAFVPLIDSGISGYFWTNQRFFSIVVYTCKGFDTEVATNFTREFFKVTEDPLTLVPANFLPR